MELRIIGVRLLRLRTQGLGMSRTNEHTSIQHPGTALCDAFEDPSLTSIALKPEP